MSWKTIIFLWLTEAKLIRIIIRPFELMEDIKANQALAPLSIKYLPWTGSSLRPAALQMILNDIVVNDKKTIVELGGGISTIYICRLLTQLKSSGIQRKLYCIEHDEQWAKILGQLLLNEGIDQELFEIIYCPLEPYSEDNKNLWYGQKTVISKIEHIDLLLVDGPPAYKKENQRAREPALSFFDEKLSSNASVYLDDIDRPGEREIAITWRRVFDYSLAVYRVKGGFAVFKKTTNSQFNN